MSTEDTTITAATPPTPPPVEGDGGRGRGRPTIAELEARKAELDAKEEDLKRRELEVELAAAEANQAMRARDLEQAEQRIAAGRNGSLRSEGIRNADVTEPVRSRKYKGGSGMTSKFDIPQEDIPLGISYQWNNYTVFGQHDHSYDARMQAQGWEPVPADRHPNLMPPGYKGPIIIDGQMLVERPIELTNEALQEEYDRARGEVRMKEEQLFGPAPGIQNQAPRARVNGTNEFISVKKGFEPGEVVQPKYQYETPGQGGVVIE